MNLHEFFKDEVKPALGCTEPGAVAFTAATAARHFEGEIEHMELKVSVSIFKNGRDVGPMARKRGISSNLGEPVQETSCALPRSSHSQP